MQNRKGKDNIKIGLKEESFSAGLICQIPRSDHITPSLDQLHWLPISDRIIYKTVLHVFKSLHGFSPLYIDSCLKIRSRPSSVTTRFSNHIFLEVNVPRSKKLAGERAFCVSAQKLWNSLPNIIKDAEIIFIHVLSCLFLFCLFCFIFWYLFLYLFICVSVLYFALCILGKGAL